MQNVAGETQQVREGVPRWRMGRRDRRAVSSLMPHGAKVLLWVVVSLLPLVGGAGMRPGRADGGPGPGPDRSLGLGGSQAEREFPITLPALVEEEQEQEDGDPYPTWQALYDPYVMDEAGSPPGRRSAGRFPRSSETSEPPPGGAPRKKKRRKKEKEGEAEKGRRGERGRGRGQAGHSPRQSSQDCRVEKREMKVRDLGLGFDSDEIIVFKFCVGSCQASRTNYDLALKVLLQNGSLPRHTARRISAQPCCRPDRYDPISFMDAQTTWRTIQSLSAASCMCMG